MSDIYRDGTYLSQNPDWHEGDSAWKARQIVDLLEGTAIDFGSVCEIGCGAGEILVQLSHHYGGKVEFDGYEISPQAHELCRPKATANVRFHLQDLLAVADARFDLVMAIDVFEHVEDYLGFLRRLRDKGTYKLFHIPLDLSVLTLLQGYPLLKWRQVLGHLHYFDKDTALASLTHAGYEIVEWRYTFGALARGGPRLRRRLVNVPRRLLRAVNEDLAARLLGGFSLLVLAR